MIRMLIVGYCFGIRSERRLCEEVHLKLAYRWFCRLGLEDAVPDHPTFSKNRHGRFRVSAAIRHVFESVLRRCMDESLVKGEGFSVDASVIKADANRARGVPGTEAIDWRRGNGPSRAVQEYLTALEQNNPTIPDDDERIATAKRISLVAPGGPAFFAYSTNYLIDLHAGIIVDAEATPSHRTQEVESIRTMVDTKADTIVCRSSQVDCAACAMKQQYCPSTPICKITRSVHEVSWDVARSIAETPAYKR